MAVRHERINRTKTREGKGMEGRKEGFFPKAVVDDAAKKKTRHATLDQKDFIEAKQWAGSDMKLVPF